MTIPAGSSGISRRVGNGTADTFDYDFKITDETDLLVTITDTDGVATVQTLTTDYTVTGVGDSTGGNITLVAGALTSGYDIVLEDNVDPDQLIPFQNQSSFFGVNHENAFDKVTRLARRALEKLDVSMLLPSNVTGVSTVLPSPQSLRLIRWNSAADALENIQASDISTTLATSNWVVDSFVGGVDYTAGTTTQLTLSQAPAVIQNTWVFFDGVPQHQTEYTLAGAVLTFTSAIPVGTSNVEVRQNEALDQGFTDASAVTYSPAGVGAVDTDVQTKLREFVSVKDFGAVGDGVTDDASAIQAALAALNGKTLYFPDGDYLVTATLSLDGLNSADIRFSGDARILAGANGVTIFKSTTNAWGVKLFDIDIRGNGYTGVIGIDCIRLEQVGAGVYRGSFRDLDTGIFLRSLCTGVKIESCDFNNCDSPIVVLDAAGGVQINHPRIDTFDAIGIDIRAAVSYPNVGVQILGGYVQNGQIGIQDKATATNILGTYFETCTVADIKLDTSFFCTIQATNHTSTGNVCIEGVNCDGTKIISPYMSSGARTVGLVDFDNTNTNCILEYSGGASGQNAPLGVSTGISLTSPIEGTFTPTVAGSSVAGAGTYSVQTGTYQRIGKYVNVNIKVVWSAHTGSGDMYIGSLPSLGNYVAGQQTPIVMYNASFTGPIVAAGFVGNNLYIYNYATSGTGSLMSLPSAGALIVNVTYKLQ